MQTIQSSALIRCLHEWECSMPNVAEMHSVVLLITLFFLYFSYLEEKKKKWVSSPKYFLNMFQVSILNHFYDCNISFFLLFYFCYKWLYFFLKFQFIFKENIWQFWLCIQFINKFFINLLLSDFKRNFTVWF